MKLVKHNGAEFRITECGSCWSWRIEDFEAFVSYIKQYDCLITSLTLTGYELERINFKTLTEALKVNRSIVSFGFYKCGNGDIYAKDLAEALKVNNTLHCLYLQDKNIGVNGAAAIAEALKFNNSVVKLNLLGNNIENKGAHAIAEALKINKCLVDIDIYHVAIDPQILKRISQMKETRDNNFIGLMSHLLIHGNYAELSKQHHFQQLHFLGKTYFEYDRVKNPNRISYQKFEDNWKAILEKQSYYSFLKCLYDLLPKNLTYPETTLTKGLEHIVDESGKQITLDIPVELVKLIFRFVPTQVKINLLDKNI